MGKTVIKCSLSVDSIQKAIKDLEQYKQDLNRKIEIFTEKLAQRGEKIALKHIQESPLKKFITLKSEKKSSDGVHRVLLIAAGEVMQSGDYPPFSTILAVEFGAGIKYNSKENPKAPEFNMGVGTFPKQTHAFDKNGWWFWDVKKEEWVHSYGVKATMPMYEASVEIMNVYKEVAKEVFG